MTYKQSGIRYLVEYWTSDAESSPSPPLLSLSLAHRCNGSLGLGGVAENKAVSPCGQGGKGPMGSTHPRVAVQGSESTEAAGSLGAAAAIFGTEQRTGDAVAVTARG